MRSTQGIAVLPLAAVLAGALAPDALAGEPTLKCEQTIVSAAGKFFAAHVRVLRKCEKRRALGILPEETDCAADEPMAGELALLAAELRRYVGKACGGEDKTCGTPDDMTLAEIGWSGVTQCPDVDGSGCTNPITHCGDVAECIRCVGEAASEQTRGVVVDDFETDEFGTDSAANRCQVALVRGTTKFLQVATKILGKCWIARLQGKHDFECPQPGGKASTILAKAEAKKVEYICKHCGGDDKTCGGVDDVAPDAIGFDTDCPDLVLPSGGSCGGAILGLEDVVDCVDCVAQFKAECVTRLASPGAAPYPAECDPAGGGSTTTTPGSTTTTTTSGGGLCGNGVLDPGEECDPAASPHGAFDGSPGGGFCAPGEVCTGACTCSNGTGTTSTTCQDSTTTTTTTSTTTTLPTGPCGNGVLDPGEECDASSPSGALVCPPGCVCDDQCTCIPGNGSSSTTVPPSSSTTTVTAPPGSTTTTTGGGATSTTGVTPTTTTTTTTGAATTTTQPSTTPQFLEFTTGTSDEACGATFEDTGGAEELDELACGGLNIGGGASTVPEGPTPDGSTTRFALDCTGTTCNLGAVSAPGATFDCTGTGCAFGTPLPIANAGLSTCVANSFAAPASGTVDLAAGTLSANVSLASRVVLTAKPDQPCPICRVGSTSGAPCAGTPDSPCTGVCQGSPNQGAACTSTNSDGLSRDCPQPAAEVGASRCYGGSNNGAVCSTGADCPGGGICSVLVGTIPVNLSPLTTGVAQKSAANGLFCPSQTSAGCFGDSDCRLIRENGAPAGSLLPVGTEQEATLASVFCIPASGAILIDGAASLPGPGATSLPVTVRLVP